jgi:hypothetical protein
MAEELQMECTVNFTMTCCRFEQGPDANGLPLNLFTQQENKESTQVRMKRDFEPHGNNNAIIAIESRIYLIHLPWRLLQKRACGMHAKIVAFALPTRSCLPLHRATMPRLTTVHLRHR